MCAINETDLALGGSKECGQPSTFSRVHEQEYGVVFIEQSFELLDGGFGFCKRCGGGRDRMAWHQYGESVSCCILNTMK